MVDYSRKYSPVQREMDAMDVGNVACFICSPYFPPPEPAQIPDSSTVVLEGPTDGGN